MVTIIKNNEFKKEEIKGLSIVDFSATWCGPCKMLKPVFDEVSELYEGKINFYNADVDENDELAEQFSISNIPALAIIKDGKIIDMQVGFKPKELLIETLEKYL